MEKHLVSAAFVALSILFQVQSSSAQKSGPFIRKHQEGIVAPEVVIQGSRNTSSAEIERAKAALEPSATPNGNGSMSRGKTATPGKTGKAGSPKSPGAGDAFKNPFKKMTGSFEKFLNAVAEGGVKVGDILSDLIVNSGNATASNVISGDGVHLTSFCVFNCTNVYVNNGNSYQQITITDSNGKVIGTASTAPAPGNR
jgi:hypothetical protein